MTRSENASPTHDGGLGAVLPELAARVLSSAPQPGVHQSPWPALDLIRADETVAHLPTVYEPSLCVVVQGSKRAVMGTEQYQYDPGQFLVVSMTLPVISQITQASVEQPYLCLRLSIDPAEVAELLVHMPATSSDQMPVDRGLYVDAMSVPLAESLLRLLRSLDHPNELPVLGPLLTREIYFRVLNGALGARLRELVDSTSNTRRISRAIELIKARYDQSLSVPDLADELHVSASTLHHRFKQLTAMTPLQFQKQLRLHEARRLMISDGLGAATAGHRVGYGSPSQFSRDYRRLFGAPPRQAIRAIAAQGG